MKRQRKDCASKWLVVVVITIIFPVLGTAVDIMGKKIKKQQMSCLTFTVIDKKQITL